MQRDNDSCIKTKRFEFPVSTHHYLQLLSFTIVYMLLKIKPDFDSNTLKDCEQKLKITACQDINEIKLDVAEIDIHQVISSPNIPVIYFHILKKDDKLIIKLGQTLKKDQE
jgi:hypothetical protein